MGEVERNRKDTRTLIVTASQRNSVKCTSGETEDHMKTKCDLAMYAWSNKLEFFTEVEMKQINGRIDFVISDWKLFIEVFKTETRESLLEKKKRLPEGFGFLPLRAGTDPLKIRAILYDLSNMNGKAWEYYYNKWEAEN